jgi:hypothetical protein
MYIPELDCLRTEIVHRRLTEDKNFYLSVRESLSRTSGEKDYDRFEHWSHGFEKRLRTATARKDMRAKMREERRFSALFREGWLACDRLLQPEFYPNP